MPNGEKEEHTRMWKRRSYPDGTVTATTHLNLINERSKPYISSGEDSACGRKTRDSICRGKSEGQGQPGQPCSGFSQQQLKLQGRGGSDSQENLSYQSNPLQELSAKGVVPFIQSHSVVLQIYQHFLCISCAYRTYYIYALLLPFHVFLCYEFY